MLIITTHSSKTPKTYITVVAPHNIYVVIIPLIFPVDQQPVTCDNFLDQWSEWMEKIERLGHEEIF